MASPKENDFLNQIRGVVSKKEDEAMAEAKRLKEAEDLERAREAKYAEGRLITNECVRKLETIIQDFHQAVGTPKILSQVQQEFLPDWGNKVRYGSCNNNYYEEYGYGLVKGYKKGEEEGGKVIFAGLVGRSGGPRHNVPSVFGVAYADMSYNWAAAAPMYDWTIYNPHSELGYVSYEYASAILYGKDNGEVKFPPKEDYEGKYKNYPHGLVPFPVFPATKDLFVGSRYDLPIPELNPINSYGEKLRQEYQHRTDEYKHILNDKDLIEAAKQCLGQGLVRIFEHGFTSELPKKQSPVTGSSRITSREYERSSGPRGPGFDFPPPYLGPGRYHGLPTDYSFPENVPDSLKRAFGEHFKPGGKGFESDG